jgi:arabinogalactan endo-1,4-beta-galactosidase
MSSRTITKVFFLFSLILIAACSSKGIVADPLVEETNDPETTTPETPTDNNFYRGTTTGFAGHLESFGNLVYKENGVQTDPYKSIADHGGNMVRFRIDLLPFASSYSTGYADPDFRSVEKVKVEMQRAKDNGLKTLITFGYQSQALEDSQKLNDYVAPLEWQSIADDIEKLKEAVYEHTYVILENYVESNLIPEIVAIGNETNWRMLQPNVLEDELQPYSAERTVTLLNSGSKAVRDINMNYGLDIQIAMHIFDASNLQWWMNTNVSLGLDFDIMALSHYQGWHSLGDFASCSEVVNWVSDNYQFFF